MIHHDTMNMLGIILARGGSKGLLRKNALPVAGRPMLAWTIEHAQLSPSLNRVVLSTDDDELAQIGRDHNVEVIGRPAYLADDTATVDAAARHAVESVEQSAGERFDAVVLLYGNVPVRPADLTDRAVEKMIMTGCDSVQSVCAAGKTHPFWMKTLAGDRLADYEPNAVYRRQDLPAVYLLDGGVLAVTRASLSKIDPDRPHAFLGLDRRAVTTEPGQVVDVDCAGDLQLAESVLATGIDT